MISPGFGLLPEPQEPNRPPMGVRLISMEGRRTNYACAFSLTLALGGVPECY